MQAIIMAGGNGTKLHPLTTNVPKPMLPLFDQPIMEHCIKLLVENGITDIIVTLSCQAQEIAQYFGDGSRWGAKIRYSVENEPMGTAGGIKLIQSMIEGSFVVISGDAITDIDLTAAIEQHKSASAIATLMLHEVDEPTQFGIVQHDSAGKITRFLEKPKTSEIFTNTASTGIYILEPEVLSSIPYYEPYDFATQLFPRMLNNQEPVYGFHVDGYWCDAGDLIQYKNAHFDALTGKLKIELPAKQVENNIWLGERVQVDSSAEISGPVYLGDGVTIKGGVRLGARTVIGANTLVDENAQISRSIIGCNSLLGKDSNLCNCVIGNGYNIIDSENMADAILLDCGKHEDMACVETPTYDTNDAEVEVTEAQLEKVAA